MSAVETPGVTGIRGARWGAGERGGGQGCKRRLVRVGWGDITAVREASHQPSACLCWIEHGCGKGRAARAPRVRRLAGFAVAAAAACAGTPVKEGDIWAGNASITFCTVHRPL